MELSTLYSADPDEMLPYAAFHLGLRCLPKYLFTSIQNEKGLIEVICYPGNYRLDGSFCPRSERVY